MAKGMPEYRISKPNVSTRRSTRLDSKAKVLDVAIYRQLPSPNPSQSKEIQTRKRERDSEDLEERDTPKRSRRVDKDDNIPYTEHDPVAYWVSHDTWPENFGREAAMSRGRPIQQESNGDSSDNNKKRKSESTHRSDRLERLAENGVFMTDPFSVLYPTPDSKTLCNSFLQGSREPKYWPSYPREQLPAILARVNASSEARIQRDMMPWVVPSAENLFYGGELTEDWIGDEIQAEWTRCATLGGTRPKPDYVAGLLRKAFTKDEVEKLRNYSSPARPFLFTPELSYPFLICEAKNGEAGLNKADRQNIHSGSIAVRAIIELYRAAFGESIPNRVTDLYGQILVFTVSHNAKTVHLYGHYAILAEDSPEKLDFHCYEIAVFSFSAQEAKDRYAAYNFVVNVYQKFADEHRQRIKAAVACLPSPNAKTGLSFSTSELGLDSDPQPVSQNTSQADSAFKVPGEPASVILKQQMDVIIAQMAQTQQENEKLREQLRAMDQQHSKQRQEDADRMERQRQEDIKRMEQQHKEDVKRMDQLMELMKKR